MSLHSHMRMTIDLNIINTTYNVLIIFKSTYATLPHIVKLNAFNNRISIFIVQLCKRIAYELHKKRWDYFAPKYCATNLLAVKFLSPTKFPSASFSQGEYCFRILALGIDLCVCKGIFY